MNEILLLSLALGALLTLVWGLLRRRSARTIQARQTIHGALHACRLLMRLLMLLQQHRGLSSGWLAGNKGFAERMLERRREIDEVLPRLAVAVREEQECTCCCVSANALRLFRFRWGEIVAGLAQASVEQNIAQHGFLIGEVLEWLSDLGEARIALLASDHVPMSLGRNFAQRLPALSEYLGQARAIGSSVAARQGCSPVARVRLLFLVARGEAILAQAWEAGAANPAERGAADSARRAVGEMTAMVRTQMLLSSGVAVSSDRFFQVATRAIDAVFAWIDACGTDLEGRLAVAFSAPAGTRAPRLAFER
jgi:nitrate/nitrite sensing protein